MFPSASSVHLGRIRPRFDLNEGNRRSQANVWALNNRGPAYLKTGKVRKARRDFEAALRIEPGFEQARKNLQSIR